MRNEDNRLVFGCFHHCMIQLVFRDRIKCTGGLIQDHKTGILVEHSRDCQLLTLPTGKVHTFLGELGGELGIQSCRERIHSADQTAVCKCLSDTRLVAAFLHIQDHIFLYVPAKNPEILEYRSDGAPIFRNIVFSDIRSVCKNLPGFHIIKPHEKLYQRRFSCAVVADECDLLSRSDMKIYLFQKHITSVAICKGYLLKLDFFCLIRRNKAFLRGDFRLIIQELPDPAHVETGLTGKRIYIRKDTHSFLHPSKGIV